MENNQKQVIVDSLSWIERFQAPTPEFFKRIRKFGIMLTTASIIVLAANSNFNLGLPPIIDQIGKYLGYGGFIAATLSSFTVDPNKLNEKLEQSSNLSKGQADVKTGKDSDS